MADPRLALPANAPGDLFVDSSCAGIGCAVCRQIAPATYTAAGKQVAVAHQPDKEDDDGRHKALLALISCPTKSIGSRTGKHIEHAEESLPAKLAEGVYACGMTSRDSQGAQSYFIRRKEGNILIDSPRFSPQLVKRIREYKGIKYMIITHPGNAADNEMFQREFECERVVHKYETEGNLGMCEKILPGDGPWTIAPGLKVILTPGHSRGHIVLLYMETFLFSGDHLFWNPEAARLESSPKAYTKSVEKLIPEQFSYVLPAHGFRYQAPRAEMEAQLKAAATRAKPI